MKPKFNLSPPSKIFISLFVAIAAVSMGLEAWQRHRYRTADSTPWRVTEVKNGESFIVARQEETKTITLCGVEGIDDNSQQFLRSVINLGDGTVVLEPAGDTYEAWISIDRDYGVAFVQHISPTPNTLIGQQIHLNTWVIERGFSRQNQENADQCHQPEHLAWAERVAKENQLRIWQNQ